MRIRISILEKDENYLKKLITALNMRYSDKMEIQAFDDVQKALENAKVSRPELFVLSSSLEVDLNALPIECTPVYFSDSNDIDSIHGVKTVGKFQKIDTIYKQFLNVYSESHHDITLKNIGNDRNKCIAFMSPAGGVGTSTVAAATALYLAKSGKKTLYIDLDTYGVMDVFFSGEGRLDIGSIIYELKKGNTNLRLKLESVIKQDPRGVYFIQQPKVLLDMMELTEQNVDVLIGELRSGLDFEYLILDMDFRLTSDAYRIYNRIDQIILVGDGSEISNRKLLRTREAYRILDQVSETPLEGKIAVIYNRFSSKTGQVLKDVNMLGGVPVFQTEKLSKIVEQISGMDFLKCLM